MAQGEAPAGATAPAPEEGQTPERPEEDGARPDQEAQGTKEDLPDLDQLLERYDPEALRKNRKLMGIAGQLADRLAATRAEALAQQRAEQLAQQRFEEQERERERKAELAAARRGDYEALGQRRARRALEEDQKRYVDQYRSRATTDAYGSVQRVVDEIASGFPPEVVATAAERLGELPANVSWEDGFKRWLPALITANAEHLASQPEQQKKVEAKITPALRQRLLAEMNGTEPVADSGGGRAQAQRQVTDEQIAAMEPEEWQQVYDVKAGKFKPGVVYKPTRALDPRALQVTGRGV
jgi:hypothetical protein